MEVKKALRKLMISKRDSISLEEKILLDKKIFENVIKSKAFIESKVIFSYVSYKNETDTHSIIKYGLNNNKIVCVPKIKSLSEGTMEAVKIDSFEELEVSALGILEPIDTCSVVDAKDIDLLLMPGLAFDNNGGRIGYGGGFYDRFLRNTRKDALKIGIGYHFQIVLEVPMENNDSFIDGIITD